MDFSFSEDQILFRDSVREFLRAEVSTERVRKLWETETARDDALWQQLAELGLTGMLVPEAFGGLGMNETDFVLLAEECGFVALPEPLVTTVLVAVPLIRDCGNAALAAEWLPRIAAGTARVAVGLAGDALVADAHVADLLLLQHGEELHALARSAVTLVANESLDPSRRLFRVEWTPSAATCVAGGSATAALLARAADAATLGAAAESLGVTQRLIELAVAYTRDRQQFGQPIGSFQAVQHLMANVAVKLEYAKAPVYRAAWSLANAHPRSALAVSHAKLAATEAAALAARNAIQVHGAMGYTWEVDVHIFAKRAWVLDGAHGDRAAHKLRVAEALFGAGGEIGPGTTF